MQIVKRFICSAVLLLGGAASGQEYTKEGELTLPDYRKWIYLGSGIGMTYEGTEAKEPPFTNVFAEPRAYDAFMKNGEWPDKTVLIAEMRASGSAVSINKAGRVQLEKIVDIEGEVKDASKGGWAFYGFGNGTRKGKLFAKSVPCYSCHEQHAAVDNTFVQFYPTLIETAKKHGTYKER